MIKISHMNTKTKPLPFSVKNARHIARRDNNDFQKNTTGAELFVALAEAGAQEKACVVIGVSPKFCSSYNRYENTVVLVDQTKFTIPPGAKRSGTQLSRLTNNHFVLLTPEAATDFMGEKN